ncbi:MAG: PilZ domain-containing protein [Bdellovibrionales bacterium]|nr:PilZ domain-containing protein [Bdellovibrionales bacterium]
MKRFLRTKIRIEYDGSGMDVDAYVSESGATRLFMEEQAPFFLSDALGKQVSVTVLGLGVPSVLVLESLKNGSFFGVKFLEVQEEARKFLASEIQIRGEVPPWVRKSPRIPVSQSEAEYPVPNLGVVRSLGKEHFVNVANFSPEGVRLESYGEALVHLKVGSEIGFDLVTNRGEVLSQFRGKVQNVFASAGDVNDYPDKGIRRAFGVKFLEVPEETLARYRSLIRDYCLVFKKKMDSGR